MSDTTEAPIPSGDVDTLPAWRAFQRHPDSIEIDFGDGVWRHCGVRTGIGGLLRFYDADLTEHGPFDFHDLIRVRSVGGRS